VTRLVPLLRVVLSVYLLTWEPLTVASELLQAWRTLGARGGWAVAELTFHLLVAVLAVAGGMALWSRSSHGPVLASLGVFASCARSLQIARYSWLPHQMTPFAADLMAIVALAHASLWVMFLKRYQDRLTDRPAPEHLRLQ